MKSKTMKRIFAGVLVLAVAIVGFIYLPESAEAESSSVVKAQKVENADFIDCINAKTAPICTLTDNDNVGYLFAGWYEDEALTTPVETKDGITADVYAKFVPSYLTGVACQIDINDKDTDTRNLRVVSLVHDQYYEAVGFNVYGRYDADGDGTNETEWLMYSHDTADKVEKAESTTLYKGLYEYSEDGSKTIKSPADVFGEGTEGCYFTTVSITGIGKSGNVDFKDATIVVKPYWITMDGTYVEGMGEYNRVNDYYNKIINVSVNLKNASKIAAGLLNITCPEGFELVEGEIGRVFEEMEYIQKGTEVRCAGNVKDIGNSGNPNDIYMNLRFEKTDGAVTLGTNQFTVSIPKDGFCDIDEKTQTDVDAWNLKY